MIHHGNTSTKMFVCWFNPAADRWLAGGGADEEETSKVVSSYWIICNNDFQFPGERKDRKSDSRQLLRPLMFISHRHWDPRCETKHCHQLSELLLVHTGKPLRCECVRLKILFMTWRDNEIKLESAEECKHRTWMRAYPNPLKRSHWSP